MRVLDLAKELKISTNALKMHLKDLGITVKSHLNIIDDEIVNKIRQKYKEEIDSVRQKELEKRRFLQQKKLVKVQAENLKYSEKESLHEKQSKDYHKGTSDSSRKIDVRDPFKPLEKAGSKPEKQTRERETKFKRSTTTSKDGSEQSSGPVVQGVKDKAPFKPVHKDQQDYHKSDKTATTTSEAIPPKNQFREKPIKKTTTTKKAGFPKYVRPADKPTETKKITPQEPVSPTQAVPKDKYWKKAKTDPDELGQKSKHIKAKLKNTKKTRKKKVDPVEIDEAVIAKNIKKTLSQTDKKKKYKKDEKPQDIGIGSENKIEVSEFTSVSELAKLMNVHPNEIIAKFFKMGQMLTINQRLDKDSLEMVCNEFDFDVVFKDEFGSDLIEKQITHHSDAEEVDRPPIVAVMGHVDHGKTSILDFIRSTNVIAGESGGITQHLGAYQVTHNKRKITFLDTPGHEAFAAMRARGANVTDIAIIVVAANEGVMPQTVEAIDHAKSAGVDIIVAVNKVDLPTSNIEKTISSMANQKIYLEGYGGDTLWVKCSALKGEGITELLDTILLAADMKELKAKKEVPGSAIVLESKKDHRMGPIITALVTEGQFKKGDNIICGATYGRIRKIENARNQELKKIGPSDVARIYGLGDVPQAGDYLNKVINDKVAKQISSERQQVRREREKYQSKTNLDNLFDRIKEKSMSELKLIIKGDTDGSVEALCDSLQKLSTDEVSVNIIRKAVGGISEADINLASASDAIVLGFQIRVDSKAKKLAEEEKVEIRLYNIIYDTINDIKAALSGLLAPEISEELLGNALVKQVFKIKGTGFIAGCAVEKGRITNDSLLRLYRNNIKVYEGEVSSLKHFAEEVKEVKAGFECGIGIKNCNDIQEGDVIEAYKKVEKARTL